MSEHIHIGKLAATHGVQGELVLKHVLGKKTNFKNASVIFIEKIRGEHLPYFHERSIIKNDAETIIKLEGINTREAARLLLQKKVWLAKADFDGLVSKSAPVNLIGFSVFNNDESLGLVESVIEQPQQVLLQLTMQGKEALIPINESTLLKIDRKKKEVYVSLPDGLLEIYLE
ncbi:ribosome maturation factor RimM [Parafilimonas sp.]|uniref:ribosome maturation factor RimM n=1 Tax=Parafilimonas sp. TaxID=1969739 RepID=UPI0039E2A176